MKQVTGSVKRRIVSVVLITLLVVLLTACSKKPRIEVVASGEVKELKNRDN